MFDELKRFVAERQHARVPRGREKLGWWVRNQRLFYGRGELAADRAARLEALPGWTWQIQAEQWERMYEALQAFATREGHIRIPKHHGVNGVSLGNWVTTQRIAYSRGKLSASRIELLEEIPGWHWGWDDRWQNSFEVLERFAQREGHANVPYDYRENGVPLGWWVGIQRRHHRQGRLAAERIEQLQPLPGWSWNIRDAKWEEMFQRLQRFAERNGHVRIPESGESGDAALANWVTWQRQEQRRGNLRPDRATRLAALPEWSWSVQRSAWEEGYQHLVRYVARERSARVSQAHEDDGYKLGVWVAGQRDAYRQGNLASDRKERLAALPDWTWDTLEASWEEAYARLRAFARREGHTRVVGSCLDNDGFRLGQWVTKQRYARNHGRLSAERERRLESLPGWVWRLHS